MFFDSVHQAMNGRIGDGASCVDSVQGTTIRQAGERASNRVLAAESEYFCFSIHYAILPRAGVLRRRSGEQFAWTFGGQDYCQNVKSPVALVLPLG